MKKLFVCVAVLLFLSPASLAQQKIPTGEDARLRKGFLEKLHAWELQIDDVYVQYTADPQHLHARARKLLEDYIGFRYKLPGAKSHEQLHEEGVQLWRDGSRDPLVLAVIVRSTVKHDNIKIFELGRKAFKDVADTYPPRWQIFVIQSISHGMRRTSVRLRDHTRGIDWGDPPKLRFLYILWMVASKDKSPEFQRYIWRVLDDYWGEDSPSYDRSSIAEISRLSAEVKIHPWMRLMVDAHGIKDDALNLWNQFRRTGVENTGWKEQYHAAATKLITAWQLQPAFPEAVTMLMEIALFIDVDVSPRQWFDRAVRTEMDDPRAYTVYRTHLRRQGAEALLAFGDECAATRRYDTKVPFELFESLSAIKSSQNINIWAKKGIYEKVKDLCQSALKAPVVMGEPQNKRTRSHLNALQLVIAVKTGRYEEIPALWKNTDIEMLRSVAYHNRVYQPIAAIKALGEAAAGTEPGIVAAVIAAFESPQQDLGSIEQALQNASARLKPANPLLAKWKADLAFLRGIHNAEGWTQLKFPDGYGRLAGGEGWTRTSDNALLCRSSRPLQILPLQHLDGGHEFRVTIEPQKMADIFCFAGVQIGRIFAVNNRWGKGCFFGLNVEDRTAFTNGRTHGKDFASSLKPGANVLSVRAWPNYWELYINGQMIRRNYNGSFRPDDQFILWVRDAEYRECLVKFSDLKVRKLNFEAPPLEWNPQARLAYFTKRMLAEPGNTAHIAARGSLYASLGKKREALIDFEEVAKLDKSNIVARYEMGRLEAVLGNHKRAMEHFESALAIPQSEEEHFVYTHDESGMLKERKVVKIQVMELLCLRELAWIESTTPLTRLKIGKTAVLNMKKCVAAVPTNPLNDVGLAAAYVNEGELLKARNVINSLKGRRMSSYTKGRLQVARELYEDAKKKSPHLVPLRPVPKAAVSAFDHGSLPPAFALDSAEAKQLRGGLQMFEYASDRSQSRFGREFFPLAAMRKVVSGPAVIDSLQRWTYRSKVNAVATGFLQVKQAGDYYFHTHNVDSRCLLMVGDKVITGVPANLGADGKVSLTPGYYALTSIGYFNSKEHVWVTMAGPQDENFQPISSSALWHLPDERRAPHLRKSIAGQHVKGVQKPPALKLPVTLKAGDPQALQLKPGLRMGSFKPLKNQPTWESVPLKEIAAQPVSDVTTIKSLQKWRYAASRNAVASGYLKIDRAGEYRFLSTGDYDRNQLNIAGLPVCKFRDGPGNFCTLQLQPGYIRIDSIGYIGAKGRADVQWSTPGSKSFGPIPEDKLFHK